MTIQIVQLSIVCHFANFVAADTEIASQENLEMYLVIVRAKTQGMLGESKLPITTFTFPLSGTHSNRLEERNQRYLSLQDVPHQIRLYR